MIKLNEYHLLRVEDQIGDAVQNAAVETLIGTLRPINLNENFLLGSIIINYRVFDCARCSCRWTGVERHPLMIVVTTYTPTVTKQRSAKSQNWAYSVTLVR